MSTFLVIERGRCDQCHGKGVRTTVAFARVPLLRSRCRACQGKGYLETLTPFKVALAQCGSRTGDA